MARILEPYGDAQEALDLYTLALQECSQREDVHRAIIRLHLQLGRVDRARDQYQILDRDLYKQLGIKPSQESLELLREIEAGRSKASQ
jgi:DNA-binding SARP family transcriptional activator